MQLHNLSKQNSIIQDLVADIRSVSKHNNRQHFRDRVEMIGLLIGYELSKTLGYQTVQVETPLGIAACSRLEKQPVLATVLRAGLPLHNGLLRAFPEADNCFIGAYRKHTPEGAFTIQMDYLAAPVLSERTLIVVDPMLATGASLILTVQQLIEHAAPERVILVSVIAASAGISSVFNALPDVEIWTAAVDTELNNKGYIVPGLGDAGDLAYGETMPR